MLNVELLGAPAVEKPPVRLSWFVLSGALFGPIAAALTIRPDTAPQHWLLSTPGPMLAASLAAGAITSLFCGMPLFVRQNWSGRLAHLGPILVLGLAGAGGLFLAAILLIYSFKGLGLAPPRTSDLLLFISMLGTWNSMSILFHEHARSSRAALNVSSRLSGLEAQIRPHFFFNTLNTVSALIPEQPETAQQILNRLAGLFRGILSTPPGAVIPLSRELELVRDYLEIERARFGQRLRYTMPPPETGADLAIPALTLQPIVENAIRHGIAKRIEGGEVTIALTVSATDYVVVVSNPVEEKPLLDPQHLLPEGHSLRIVADRLRLLYRGRARMSVECQDTFRMSIQIPRPMQIRKRDARVDYR